MILSGCASLDGRVKHAAAIQAHANIHYPPADMPDDCDKREPHAALTENAEVRSILKRERAALDRANDRIVRCTTHAEEHFVIRPVEPEKN
jgi:hypothetical protein